MHLLPAKVVLQTHSSSCKAIIHLSLQPFCRVHISYYSCFWQACAHSLLSLLTDLQTHIMDAWRGEFECLYLKIELSVHLSDLFCKRPTSMQMTSVAIMVVVYALRALGDPDLPTPLLSIRRTLVLGGSSGLLLPSSSSSCGAQQPWVAPNPMMRTTSGRCKSDVLHPSPDPSLHVTLHVSLIRTLDPHRCCFYSKVDST